MLLISLNLLITPAFAAEPLPLDAHVHLNGRFAYTSDMLATTDPTPEEDYRNELKAVLDQSGAGMSFVITPTFATKPISRMFLSESKRVNELVSLLLTAESGRARGLCGVPMLRKDALEVAEHCLALPGMIGAKIRMFSLAPDVIRSEIEFRKNSDTPSSYDHENEGLERFRALVKKIADRDGILLAHFGSAYATGVHGRLSDTDLVLQVMSEHPRATLIIAHAGTASYIGLNGLERIGQYYREHPEKPRNIWLETSFAWAQSGPDAYKDPFGTFRDPNEKTDLILNSWRSFGLEWVLFGSDIMFPDLPEEGPWKSDRLTPKEKKTILHLNGRRLLERLRLGAQSGS